MLSLYRHVVQVTHVNVRVIIITKTLILSLTHMKSTHYKKYHVTVRQSHMSILRCSCANYVS